MIIPTRVFRTAGICVVTALAAMGPSFSSDAAAAPTGCFSSPPNDRSGWVAHSGCHHFGECDELRNEVLREKPTSEAWCDRVKQQNPPQDPEQIGYHVLWVRPGTA